MTFLLSKSTVIFFSGSSKDCASTGVRHRSLQTNGFETPLPKATALYVVVLMKHRAAEKGSTEKVERGVPRVR